MTNNIDVKEGEVLKDYNPLKFTNFPNSGTTKSSIGNYLPRVFTTAVWLAFFSSITFMIYVLLEKPDLRINGIFLLDGLTMVMWVVVTFFSGIIHSYSLRYMAGYKRLNSFLTYCSGFTIAVMLFVAADHILVFILSWLAMGVIMAGLIGHVPNWNESRAASANALKYFSLSTLFLGGGVLLLAFNAQSFTVSSIIAAQVPGKATVIASFLILIAAVIQSAIYPFHKWLLSSMTAPTPASALMHAGFVNAAGILLTRFAPVLYAADFFTVIVLIGGAGALLGEFAKLAQVNIKRKLACSTLAQMGFMILQCGLGFFSAAVTHLILHGFFKAYLFLSSGSEIQQTVPVNKEKGKIYPLQVLIMIISGIAGAFLFSILTGKGIAMDSSLFLTFIVVLTVMQVSMNILKQPLPAAYKLMAIPFITLSGITVYALVFNGISFLMKDMLMVNQPTEFSFVHGLLASLFLAAFLVVELEWHKKSKRIYVAILNLSQPDAKTV